MDRHLQQAWPGGVHRKWVGSKEKPEHEAAGRFTVLTWNCQAAKTRGRDVDAADRRGVEACLQQILHDLRLRSPTCPDKPPDLLSLQELQRCPRQVKRGDCRYCARDICRYDHAHWVSKELERAGYSGATHQHDMINTVGLFWRRDTFELPPRHAKSTRGTVFFVDFDRPHVVGGRRAGAQ